MKDVYTILKAYDQLEFKEVLPEILCHRTMEQRIVSATHLNQQLTCKPL